MTGLCTRPGCPRLDDALCERCLDPVFGKRKHHFRCPLCKQPFIMHANPQPEFYMGNCPECNKRLWFERGVVYDYNMIWGST